MPTRGGLRSARTKLTTWLVCVALSGILIAVPRGIRDGVASGLEWSVFLPVRSVLGWGGRSLFLSMQNRQLQRELGTERLRAERLEDSGRENETLRDMLGMAARDDIVLIPAQVRGRSLDRTGEVLLIEASGRSLEPGLAVVTPDGLLGRLARSSGTRGQVETLWHTKVAVSVVDARSGEQGILRWDPVHPRELVIEQVPFQADYRTGDAVVTTGMGEVFPRGILVGHVLAGEEDRTTQLRRIRIRPAVARGRALEVFLLTERPPFGDASSLYPVAATRSGAPAPMPAGAFAHP